MILGGERTECFAKCLVLGDALRMLLPLRPPSPLSSLPCFPFLSLPVSQERSLEHEIKAGDKPGSCGQSRSPTGMTPARLSHRLEGEERVCLQRPWWLLLLPLLRDSRSWGHFRLLLIGLLVCKAHPHTLLHLIVPITTSQLMFPSFYR